MGESGYEIAMRVDPNVSDDVCTFCKHATFHSSSPLDSPVCALGFTPYFRSISNMGPIWVSDCEHGELRPELAAIDTAKNHARPTEPKSEGNDETLSQDA